MTSKRRNLRLLDRHAERLHHASVIATYGCETSVPSTSTVVGVARIGQRHEQAAEELAGDVALDEGVAAVEPVGLDRDGRAAGAEVAPGVGPQAVEGHQQVGHGPLPHPGRAVEPVRSRAGRDQRGQEPQARPRVGD